jgi:hypothetical protein
VSARSTTTAAVERRYDPSPDACAEAVRILLRPDRKRGRFPDKSGPDDAKGPEDVLRHTHSTR